MSLETVQLHKESGGSFSVRGVYRDIPPDRMMPTEEVLPGVLVPLLIIPNYTSGRWDDDHARFEVHDPRLTIAEFRDLHGKELRPLRYCMVQRLPRATHERKNDAFDAVEVPTAEDKVFQAVLLGAASYITRYWVDLNGKEPTIRELTDGQRAEAHSKNWVGMQRGTRWHVGYYIAQYSLKHGLDAVRDSDAVDRFMSANLSDIKKRASFEVMRLAVQAVVEPFEPTYETARRSGAIRKPEATAARFITRYFDKHQPDYVPTITDGLLAA